MGQEELQLSPEEERLLRRFFHRRALPYAAVAVVLAVLVGMFAHGLRGVDSAPQLEAAPLSPVDLTAFETTRAAAEGLLVELQKAAQRDQDGLAAIERRMSELEKRTAGARERLQQLDARVQEVAALAAAAPPPAAPVPVSSPRVGLANEDGLRERIYSLEVRQDQVEARSAKQAAERIEAIKEILDRLYELETRTTAVEQARRSEVRAAPEHSDVP